MPKRRQKGSGGLYRRGRVVRVISVEGPRWTRLRGMPVVRRRELLRQIAERMR